MANPLRRLEGILIGKVRTRPIPTVRRIMITLAAVVATSGAGAQPSGRAELQPRDPIAAITSELDARPVVAIGEIHRNQEIHDLIAELVRDARFLPGGGDIVVEFGNGRYQDRMDRYIAGEAIDPKSLAVVWRDTVNILVWDAPVYERFFATVRDVNRTRPTATRLRVVLADPPIDWTAIGNRRAWEHIAATRDRHFADVIEREVLARGRRALLIFGSGHVQHEAAFDRHGTSGRRRLPNLAELLDAEHSGATFYVTADWMNDDIAARLARWQPPLFFRLKGTWLGDAHVGPPSQGPRLEELADAVLYLGPPSSLTTSSPAREIYSDTTYLRELIRRDTLQGGTNAAVLRELRDRFLNERTR